MMFRAFGITGRMKRITRADNRLFTIEIKVFQVRKKTKAG